MIRRFLFWFACITLALSFYLFVRGADVAAAPTGAFAFMLFGLVLAMKVFRWATHR